MFIDHADHLVDALLQVVRLVVVGGGRFAGPAAVEAVHGGKHVAGQVLDGAGRGRKALGGKGIPFR